MSRKAKIAQDPTDYFSSVSDTTWRLEISKTTSAGVAYPSAAPSAAAVLRSGISLEPDVTGFYDEATGSVQYLVADPITRAVRSLTRCSTLIQRQAPLREITPEHYDRVFALDGQGASFPRAEVAADDGQWRIDHPRGLGYSLHGPGEPLGLRGHQGGCYVRIHGPGRPSSRTVASARIR